MTTPNTNRARAAGQNWEQELSDALQTLSVISGVKDSDIKKVCASIAKKERKGKLPANAGWLFAAQQCRSALRMAVLAGFPCRSAEKYAAAETKRAVAWIKKAQAATV